MLEVGTEQLSQSARSYDEAGSQDAWKGRDIACVDSETTSRTSYDPLSTLDESSASQDSSPRRHMVFNSLQRRSTLAITPMGRKSNDLSSLTINKLRTNRLGLHGREKEQDFLKSAFKSVVEGSVKRQLILISGHSGTGKTALADILQKEEKRSHGLFAKGKFDLKLRDQPYSGISTACAEICGTICDLIFKDSGRAEKLIDTVKDELGSELQLLAQIVPALHEIIDIDTRDTTQTTSSLSSSVARSKFNFAIVRFIRIISRFFTPATIVLDDVQWADAASLELLEVLLTDAKNSKLILVVLYRSNEVDQKHIFHHTLQALTEQAKDKAFEMLQVETGNLEVTAVHTLIQEALSMDDQSRTLPLAELCWRKTEGNVFFLLQYLSMLDELELLKYNFGTFTWTWDLTEIETSTSVSDNVLDLLKSKMSDLDADEIWILKVAASLGSTFDLRSLQLVWRRWKERDKEGPQEGPKEGAPSDLLKSIDKLISAGYIVNIAAVATKRYCWEHDKIHEAALSMIADGERASLGREIGNILFRNMSEEELNSPTIFVVVNLLNVPGAVLNEEDRLELVHLNDMACRKAISLSAFESAASYASNGISNLPTNAWEMHYDVTLSLYTNGAKSEAFIGHKANMEKFCQEVLSRENVPMEDKFDVYNTWIDSLMNTGSMKEGRDILLVLLKQLKTNFRSNPLSIVWGILKNVVRIKATMATRDVTKLAPAQNHSTFEIMKLLDKLATTLYLTSDDRMPLAVFRSLNISVDVGCCAYSPVAFATAGIMLTGVLNDIQGGSKYGEKAMLLLEQVDSRLTRARTMFCINLFVFPWTKPTRSLLKPVLEAYDIGLQTGDTESACFVAYGWVWMRFLLGTSLEIVEADCALYCKQMKDLNRSQALFPTLLLWQSCLNLIGHNNCDDPTCLTGDAFTEDDYRHFMNYASFDCISRGFKSHLLCLFGRHVECAELILKHGHDEWEKKNVAFFVHPWTAFLRALSCFAAARQTRKRKYRKLANMIHRKLKAWAKMGNPNVHHYVTFLDAEAMACQGNIKKAISNYEVTILMAVRGGYLHVAGFASERLAQYQLEILRDVEESSYRFREAVKYFSDWGAKAKAEALNERHIDLQLKPIEILTSRVSELTNGGL